MSNTKKFIIFFFIGILLAVGGVIFDKFNYHQPIKKEKFDIGKIGSSVELDIKFNKSGCYEVGFGSYEYRFFGRGKDVNDTGEYKIEYFDKNGKLLQEKITSFIGGGAIYSRTSYSNAPIDYFQIPINNNKNIKAKLTVLKPDHKFIDLSYRFYFYADKANFSCDSIEKAKITKYVDSVNFNTNQTNQTLQPLFEVLLNKDTQKVKKLIPSQFDVNVNMLINRKPIHYATYFDDEKAVEYLISLNASLDDKDLKGNTPLIYAVENNSTKIVKLLIDSGADVSKSYRKDTFLMFDVICKENYELLEYLLQSPKIDNNAINGDKNIYRIIGADSLKEGEIFHSNYCKATDEKYRKEPTTPQMWTDRILKAKVLLDKYGVKPNEQNVTHSIGTSVQFDEPVKEPNILDKLDEIFKK